MNILKDKPGVTEGNNDNDLMDFVGVQECEIPVVLIEYEAAEYAYKRNLIEEVQKEFESRGYSCAVLHDQMEESDFERGWYKILPGKFQKTISVYQKILTDGIILLFLQANDFVSVEADLVIKEEAIQNRLHGFEAEEIVAFTIGFFKESGENDGEGPDE